ncbi:MAG: hypothetical protein ACRDJC_16500 [Thermomicrobiales bacterium]
MDDNRFDALTRAVTASGSRRALFGALTAGAGLLRGAAGAAGKKKQKRKKGKNLCRADGSQCKKENKRCKAKFCLKTPFTIEARWTNENTDQDTVLFVPNEAGSLDPSPFIDQRCNSDDTNDGTLYPFAFVSGDAQGPGDEITTIRQLLPGAYEFWIELFVMSPAADLTVLLRNANGTVLRGWTSPANPDPSVQRGWHVFNIDGAKHSITSVDQLHDDHPLNENVPVTNACP